MLINKYKRLFPNVIIIFYPSICMYNRRKIGENKGKMKKTLEVLKK